MKSLEKNNRSAGTVLRSALTNDKYGALILAVAFFIIFSIMESNMLTYRNVINLFRQSSFYIIVSLGLLCIFMIGEIDLCVSSTMGLCGLLAAMMAQEGSNIPIWLIFVIVIVIGAAIGLINGILVGYCGFPSFIATLGMQMAMGGVMLIITGGRAVSNLKASFCSVGTGYFLGVPYPVYLTIGLCILTWFIMCKTVFGRHMAAVGGNTQAAVVSGINVRRTKCMTFIYCNILAAISGAVLCARFSTGQLSLGTNYEMYGIAGAVIGGASMSGGYGTVFGVYFGSMVICILRTGLDMIGVNAYWQQFVQGLVILLAVSMDIVRKRTKNIAR